MRSHENMWYEKQDLLYFDYDYVVLIKQLSETVGIGTVIPKYRKSAKTLYGLYKIKNLKSWPKELVFWVQGNFYFNFSSLYH